MGLSALGVYYIVIRLLDDDNCWSVRLASTSKLELVKKVAGASTTMGSVAISPADGDIVIARIKDDVITVFYNGVQKFQITDTNLNSFINCGFGGYNALGASFDSFEVEAI